MKCPGQDSRYWESSAVFEAACPKCKNPIEFFKDDSTRKCSNCGHRMLNPENDFGCAAYCPYAEQCLGSLPPELLAKKQNLLKERVAIEMKRYFDNDFKRIGHATRVARYAEEIGKETESNPAVTLIAAYLHDIGIKEAEKKHNSAAPRYQHEEGPPVARDLLSSIGATEELINDVCKIIDHHHTPKPEESLEFKAVYDADLIANLEEKHKESPLDATQLENILKTSFLTEHGAKLAAKMLT